MRQAAQRRMQLRSHEGLVGYLAGTGWREGRQGELHGKVFQFSRRKNFLPARAVLTQQSEDIVVSGKKCTPALEGLWPEASHISVLCEKPASALLPVLYLEVMDL